MKRLLPALLSAALAAAHLSLAKAGQTVELPLWPAIAPGDVSSKAVEADTSKPNDGLVAGKSVVRLGNVSQPTVAYHPAQADKNTGALVLVCPGGGYNILAMDLEGTEICDWLNGAGVNAALLKYRVPRRPDRAKHDAPLQDSQRAMGLIRQHAAEWGVDPNRVGILGFSAGGHLAAATSCQFTRRTYPRVDAADDLPSRPDFTILIYPAYLTATDGSLDLAPEIAITAKSPPAFIAMTVDDPVHYENAVAYATALRRANQRVELHLFPSGGHGYGLRRPGPPVTSWPERAAEWLGSEGWLKPRKPTE